MLLFKQINLATGGGGGVRLRRRVKAFTDGQPYSGSMPAIPPDEHMLALRQVDQLRTDMANLEAGQEFLMQQINRLQTARDLWRAATLIGLVGAVLGIVGIEAFWRYFACGSI